MHITVGPELDPVLMRAMTPDNPGLPLVRELIVSSATTYADDRQRGHQWLTVLINILPRNILLKFHWKTPHPLPAELLKTLWQRQKHLTNLEIVPAFFKDSWSAATTSGDEDLLAELNRLELKDVRGLRVVPDGPGIAFVGCAALKKRTVTIVEVDERLWRHGDPYINKEGEHIDELTGSLFSHLERAWILFQNTTS